MFKLQDETLKFSPSDINTSVKISLFVKDLPRKQIKVRERYIDINEVSLQDRRDRLKEFQLKMTQNNSFKLLSEPIEDIIQKVKERRTIRAKLKETKKGQMEEEYSPNGDKSTTLPKKYEPKAYLDLIGDEVINRGVLKWLKSWEVSVFGDKKFKAKTREQDAWKQKSFRKKNYASTSLYWKTKIMLDNTQLNIQDECEKLRNKIPIIVGDSGTGKSTLAIVIAKHCKYEPVVVNLSTIKSVDELIRIIKNETMSYNIASMGRALQQKEEQKHISGSKKTIFGVVGGKKTPEDKKRRDKIKKKPTCLILDEIDTFFNGDLRAQWTLINFLYKQKSQNSIEELFQDESKAKKQLTSRRPIILISENIFGKGLWAFRKNGLIFRIYKNHEMTYKRVSQVCQEEKLDLANDIIDKICLSFKDHLGAILNFLDLIRKGAAATRTEILNLLERTTIEQIEKDYFSVFKVLFDKSKRQRRFHSRIQ